MKKKFTLKINTPCSENFDKMIPNANGSFCNSCARNVIDLSRKTNSEVAKFIVETKDATICARLKVSQLNEEFEYNEISKINNLKYAAVAASILLASNVIGQEKEPVQTEINYVIPANSYTLGKISYTQAAIRQETIIVKGRLIEAKTNKPFNSKKYPNLVLTINGAQGNINSKTGEFSISTQVLKKDSILAITITGDDYYVSKEIPFSIKAVNENVLHQNIIISADELSKVETLILGGLGINYIDEKVKKQI